MLLLILRIFGLVNLFLEIFCRIVFEIVSFVLINSVIIICGKWNFVIISCVFVFVILKNDLIIFKNGNFE